MYAFATMNGDIYEEDTQSSVHWALKMAHVELNSIEIKSIFFH